MANGKVVPLRPGGHGSHTKVMGASCIGLAPFFWFSAESDILGTEGGEGENLNVQVGKLDNGSLMHRGCLFLGLQQNQIPGTEGGEGEIKKARQIVQDT